MGVVSIRSQCFTILFKLSLNLLLLLKEEEDIFLLVHADKNKFAIM